MLEGSVEQVEVLEMMEGIVNQPSNKFEARVVRVTEETFAKTMETVDTDHN